METVEYEGLVLPPPDMPRHGGKTDEKYVREAKANVGTTQEMAGLTADSRVLDIGCGSGRFLTGMLATFGRVRSYIGLDVRKRVIEWAQEALTRPEWGEIRFGWLDVENTRYNKAGAPVAQEQALPVDDDSVDVVVLFSVFSHMIVEDTGVYLKEINRVLVPDGRCLCTAFVEDGVPDWEENPAGYLRPEWSGPLHCARFNRSVFDRLVVDGGLSIQTFSHRGRPSGQSIYVLAPS